MLKKERKKAIAELDRLCRQFIKWRDGYKCQRCGKGCSGRGCHWAHVWGRRSYIKRWDPLNSLVLCAGHHRWAHSNPLDFTQWFKEAFPARWQYWHQDVKDWDGSVKVRRHLVRPIRDDELEGWLNFYREKTLD